MSERPRANDKAAVVIAAPVPVSNAVDLQSLTSRSPEQRRQDALRRQQVAEKTRPLKKELEQTEKRMALLAQEKTKLETALSQPLNSSDIADSGRRLKAVNDENDTLEARWLELTEAIEAASA